MISEFLEGKLLPMQTNRSRLQILPMENSSKSSQTPVQMEDRSLAALCVKSWSQLSFLSADTARKPSLDVTHPEQSRVWSRFVALQFGADGHRTTEGFAWDGP